MGSGLGVRFSESARMFSPGLFRTRFSFAFFLFLSPLQPTFLAMQPPMVDSYGYRGLDSVLPPGSSCSSLS